MSTVTPQDRRRYEKNSRARRYSDGFRRIAVELSPQAIQALERLTAIHGTQVSAVEAALIALAGKRK